MFDIKKTSYTVEDLQLTDEFKEHAGAQIAQRFLIEVLKAPYLGHNTSRFKGLLLSLYNSDTYPLDIQSLGAMQAELFDQAMALMTGCLKGQLEPYRFFENGQLLFAKVLPKWGAESNGRAPEDFAQQQFLRDALKTLKLTREQLSEAIGVSKRGLDKWFLPAESQDFRPMGAPAIHQVKALLRMGPILQESWLPENNVLTMGLACKAFALLGRDTITVSAELSTTDPEGLKNFGDFQKVLAMAYREGATKGAPTAPSEGSN